MFPKSFPLRVTKKYDKSSLMKILLTFGSARGLGSKTTINWHLKVKNIK